MKKQLDLLLETAKQTGTLLREKAAEASQATVQTVMNAIERWLEEFPKIMAYGLNVRTFGFTMGLSPSLEIELGGEHARFPPSKLNQILAENKATSLTYMIFQAIKTAYQLHRHIAPQPEEPLIVKIRLAISPEISVSIGRPRLI